MPSKAVTDRQKSADYVLALAETQIPVVSGALGSSLSPLLLDGEKVPDLSLLVRLVLRMLGTAKAAMVAADAQHEAELQDDPLVRDARDAALASLYAQVVDLRQFVEGAYGAAAAKAVGFDGKTPDDPVVLCRFADAAVNALLGGKLAAPRFAGLLWDMQGATGSVLATAAELSAKIEATNQEVREAQVTQAEKDKAISTYNDVFSRVAGFLSSLFRLAGHDDLADNIRPSRRHPGRTESQLEDEPTAEA